MNKIYAKGKVVDIYIGSKVSTITLQTKIGERYFFPSFKFVGTKAAEPSKFKKGDLIIVEGSIRSFAKKQEDASHKFIQYNRGKSIEYAINDLLEAFGIKINDDNTYSDSNFFEIRGYIQDIRISDGCANILINPQYDNCSVWVKLKSDKPYSVLNDYPYGTFVDINGYLLTYRKKHQREKVEQLIVSCIFKQEK